MSAYPGFAQSRRCSQCSIQYPPEITKCLVCEGPATPMYKSGPDEDWKEKVESALGVESLETGGSKIAYTQAHPRHDIQLPVAFENDRLWISHNDLTEAGYLNLEAGSVVWVNDKFYELQGRSSRTRMRAFYWWVEEIVTEGAADDLTPEMFTRVNPEDDGA